MFLFVYSMLLVLLLLFLLLLCIIGRYILLQSSSLAWVGKMGGGNGILAVYSIFFLLLLFVSYCITLSIDRDCDCCCSSSFTTFFLTDIMMFSHTSNIWIRVWGGLGCVFFFQCFCCVGFFFRLLAWAQGLSSQKGPQGWRKKASLYFIFFSF